MKADKIKTILNTPDGYEMTCRLTIGYPTENAFLPRQKAMDVADRIETHMK